MNEELDQIEKNNTWEMVQRPEGKNVIGSKWIFKNKLNEQGQVIRNLWLTADLSLSECLSLHLIQSLHFLILGPVHFQL